MSEEFEGTEVTEYKLTPELLEAMITATLILEELAEGKLTLQEARALYEEKVLPVIKELQAKSRPAKSKSKKKSSKSKSSKKEKSSSKSKTSKSKKSSSKKKSKSSKKSSKKSKSGEQKEG